MTGMDWAIGWVRDTWPVWAALGAAIPALLWWDKWATKRQKKRDAAEAKKAETELILRRLSPPPHRRFVPTVIAGGRGELP